MSDEFRDLLERAALDPDPTFVADVEATLTGEGAGTVVRLWARPARSHTRVMAVAASLAAVAAVVVGLALASRTNDAGTGDSPPASATTTITSVAATTVAPTVASTAAPTTTAAPPSTAAAPPPTTVATPTTAAAAVTTVAASAAGPMPTGLTPVSITHVSLSHLWLLATDASGAPRLFESRDTGRSFRAVALPADYRADDVGPRVRFASSLDGYLVGAGLWSTHDGAQTWRSVDLPRHEGADRAYVFDVAALDGEVTVATMEGLFSSPIGRDAFVAVSSAVNVGAGPVPQGHLVLVHGGGWFVMDNRGLTDARRKTASGWVAWTPPCRSLNGPVQLAAADATHLVAVCDDRMSTGGPGRVYRSDDGGVSFTAAGTLPGLPDEVAMADADSAVVSVQRTEGGVVLVGVFRGRADLPVVFTAGDARLADLGFTSATYGSVVGPGLTGALAETTDAGRTWHAVGSG